MFDEKFKLQLFIFELRQDRCLCKTSFVKNKRIFFLVFSNYLKKVNRKYLLLIPSPLKQSLILGVGSRKKKGLLILDFPLKTTLKVEEFIYFFFLFTIYIIISKIAQ